MNIEGYQAILNKSNEIGWPKFYRADLTKHDFNQLLIGVKPERFIWIVRECGTHLYWDMNETWTKGAMLYHVDNQTDRRFFEYTPICGLIEIEACNAIATLRDITERSK